MILITEFMDENSVNKLKQKYKVIYDPSLADRQDEILSKMNGVSAIIVRNRTQITENILKNSPDLVCVGRLGVGLDNIDIGSCKDHDVTVYPATGANTNSVVEYVISTALVLLRGAYLKNDEMISGDWPRQESSGDEISGKHLGLIGFGEIAQKTSTIAKYLGMSVSAYDPFLKEDHIAWKNIENQDLDSLLQSSDIISIHTPLNKGTQHLINEKKLSLLKPSAILINAARGGIVDEVALAKILNEGKIKGAALDVFENEPLDRNHGQLFKGLKNVILTPHIAGVTFESNIRVSEMIADCVDTHLSKR